MASLVFDFKGNDHFEIDTLHRIYRILDIGEKDLLINFSLRLLLAVRLRHDVAPGSDAAADSAAIIDHGRARQHVTLVLPAIEKISLVADLLDDCLTDLACRTRKIKKIVVVMCRPTDHPDFVGTTDISLITAPGATKNVVFYNNAVRLAPRATVHTNLLLLCHTRTSSERFAHILSRDGIIIA